MIKVSNFIKSWKGDQATLHMEQKKYLLTLNKTMSNVNSLFQSIWFLLFLPLQSWGQPIPDLASLPFKSLQLVLITDHCFELVTNIFEILLLLAKEASIMFPGILILLILRIQTVTQIVLFRKINYCYYFSFLMQ